MIIIPARIGSSRVTKKMLRNIKGKQVIQHTVNNVLRANVDEIVVATDSEFIAELDLGVKTILMTTVECANGTERCAYIAEQLNLANSEPVINVQGDKWDVNPEAVVKIHGYLKNVLPSEKHKCMITMHEDITDTELHNPSIIKVVVNNNKRALFFTRCPIKGGYKHTGIYGYHVAFFKQYMFYYKSRILENNESLEQMRVLENGGEVLCPYFKGNSGGSINTEVDLLRANKL